jgi:hypothetical protein
MALSLVKTGAIAATALLLSVTGAFAATYGHVNYDTSVKKVWASNSPTVFWLDAGDYVKVIDYTSKNGGWYRVDPPGANNAGWVKKSALDLYNDDDYYDAPNGLTVCGPGIFGGKWCAHVN